MNILVRELRIDTPFFGAAKNGRIVVQAQRHLADSLYRKGNGDDDDDDDLLYAYASLS